MTNMAIPLHDLGQRISQQQAELEKLRKEYEARQTKMGELARRKEQLLAQLRHVEEELRVVDAGGTPTKRPAPAAIVASKKPTPAATPAAKPAKKPATKPTKKVPLVRLLVEIVNTAGRAMKLKDLTQELEKRKYATTSTHLARMVKNRITALVKKKLLRRAENKKGVLPAKRPATAPGDLTLVDAVTQVLAKSAHPLSAKELADKVLESGYHTKSKDFRRTVMAAAWEMPNVEHLKGKGSKGYRLKKGKAAK